MKENKTSDSEGPNLFLWDFNQPNHKPKKTAKYIVNFIILLTLLHTIALK